MDTHLKQEITRLQHLTVQAYWLGQDNNYQYFQNEYIRLTGVALPMSFIEQAKPVRLQG